MLQVRPNCACGDRDLPPIADAATARAVMQKLSEHLRAAGMDRFRAPPPEPTTCCGRGCDGCVWASYFAAMGRWRDDALALLSPNVADPAPERRR